MRAESARAWRFTDSEGFNPFIESMLVFDVLSNARIANRRAARQRHDTVADLTAPAQRRPMKSFRSVS